jgi:elongator complex protein 3
MWIFQSKIQNPKSSRTYTLESTALLEAQRVNETARHRIIGLTIETRPDYISQDEIRRLRELGVTRVELGVQTLNDRILELIVRDHTTEAIRRATTLLRDAAFKVAYHLMPNLPGASPEDDLRTFYALFEDPAYRPDTLKIYPCVVVETAALYQWWQQGRYQPYDDETLVELLIQLKVLVPPYVRIERVIRDIPSISIQAGCKITNLREEVHKRMRARGLRCRCIRCREARDGADGSFVLVRRDYEASGGRELFLSFEDSASDRLAAFLRLRIPGGVRPQAGSDPFPALEDAALIRELHTYGQHVPLHDRSEQAIQHRGFGKRLLAEAERIAREEFGLSRMVVIAGVGVREYYRKFGYALGDTYMVKRLFTLPCSSNGQCPDGNS